MSKCQIVGYPMSRLIFVLIAKVTKERSDEPVHSCQRLHCLHIQSMEVDERSCQNLNRYRIDVPLFGAACFNAAPNKGTTNSC